MARRPQAVGGARHEAAINTLMRFILILRAIAAMAALLAAACTTPVPPAGTETAGLRCTRETPTGSNIPVTRCRTEDDLRREAEATNSVRDALEQTRPGVGGPIGQ